MLILPAIDLIGGRPIRLTRGNFETTTEYNRDPISTAIELEEIGAAWIHIVDLDAARGSGDNRKLIANIRKAVRINVQVGGGVRTVDDARELIDMGVDRIIVGSSIARDPQLPTRWVEQLGNRLVAGIDAENGIVKIDGWDNYGTTGDLELVKKLGEQPIHGIVYTNISQDGTLAGPDIPRTNKIAESSRRPVILSGGIGSLEHVKEVRKYSSPGVLGIIIGKAWYEGLIDLRELFGHFPQKEAGRLW